MNDHGEDVERGSVAQPDGAVGGAMHCPEGSQKKGSAQPSTSSHDVRHLLVATSQRKGAHSVLLLPSAAMMVWSPSQYAVGTHFASAQA